jgi:hypothetical protein
LRSCVQGCSAQGGAGQIRRKASEPKTLRALSRGAVKKKAPLGVHENGLVPSCFARRGVQGERPTRAHTFTFPKHLFPRFRRICRVGARLLRRSKVARYPALQKRRQGGSKRSGCLATHWSSNPRYQSARLRGLRTEEPTTCAEAAKWGLNSAPPPARPLAKFRREAPAEVAFSSPSPQAVRGG